MYEPHFSTIFRNYGSSLHRLIKAMSTKSLMWKLDCRRTRLLSSWLNVPSPFPTPQGWRALCLQRRSFHHRTTYPMRISVAQLSRSHLLQSPHQTLHELQRSGGGNPRQDSRLLGPPPCFGGHYENGVSKQQVMRPVTREVGLFPKTIRKDTNISEIPCAKEYCYTRRRLEWVSIQD